ncbi:MAG TPA: carboxypeptidase regulatory-like domain-containing protein [Terriglobia bacterium]|nr:carboxypeptidase regulatory-like domain-containing protein [Terriglobia bacterium]
MRHCSFLRDHGRWVLSAALLLVLFLMCPALPAQSPPPDTGGTITGKVSGPGGVLVPGARIILFNPQTRTRKETWSDTSGNYVFSDVPPGQYRVVIVLVGFRPSILGPVTVTTGKPSDLNATLALAMPGEPSTFGRSMGGQMAGGSGRAAQYGQYGRNSQSSQGSRPGQSGAQGRGSNQAMNRAGAGTGSANPANPAGAGSLSSILADATGSGNGADSTSLRFSGNGASGGAGAQGQGNDQTDMGAGGDSGGGSAGAGNSFLLSGQTVDATAPAMRRGGGRRVFIMGGGPGGGPEGTPFDRGGGGFGGRGGGGMVFFFGGGRNPRANRIRGNMVDTYTNSALDAAPFTPNTPSQQKAAFYNERIGINFGGPLNIPKIYNGGNKTNFFVSYNTSRSTQPNNLLGSVPTQAERNGDFSQTVIASGPFAGTVPSIFEPSITPGARTPFPNNQIPTSMINSAASGLLSYIPLPNLPGETQNYHTQLSLPNNNQFFMGRVGQQFSAKDNLAVFYYYGSANSTGVATFPDITSTDTSRNQDLSLTETHNFGPRMVNTVAANFNRTRGFTTNLFAFKQNIAGELGILGISANPMDWGLPSIGFTNFSSLGDATPSLSRNQTLRFSDFVFYNRGKHNIQMGGDISKIQLNSLSNQDAEGNFSFTGYGTSDFTPQGAPVAGTGYDFADFLLGVPQTTSERFGIPANYLRSSRYDFYGQDDWRTTDHLTLNLGGRWEYAAPFTEKYGHLSDLAIGEGFSTVGVVTGQQPGNLPSSLLRGHASNVTPRIGIAYRPWIAHSLVLRAGYSVYYDESIYQQLVRNLVNQAPFATTSTLVTSPGQPLTLQNGFPAISAGTARNTFAVDPNLRTPYAQSWNLMLEQDLTQTYILSVAYIGTRGTHLNLLEAPDVTISSTGQPLIANALPFEYDTSGASSLYNGLRVSLRHFSRRDFSFFLNYTYSKSEDNASSVGGTASAGGSGGGVVQNPFNLRAEWALSGFNDTHSLRAFTRYQLPFGDRKHFLNHGGTLARVLGNWALSDNTSFSSGTPLTAFVTGNLSNNAGNLAPFGGLRANATGLPVSLTGGQQSTLEYFNTAAFGLPAAGEYGNAGRNTIPGPPSLNFNVSVDKTITISREKGMTADFRVGSSNTFNIVNLSGLSTTLNGNDFGRVNEAGNMRTVTFSLRFRF